MLNAGNAPANSFAAWNSSRIRATIGGVVTYVNLRFPMAGWSANCFSRPATRSMPEAKFDQDLM
jgi:hypothetical protein